MYTFKCMRAHSVMIIFSAVQLVPWRKPSFVLDGQSVGASLEQVLMT